MSGQTPAAAPERNDRRYHGFSLRSVCWGYRDLFERVIEGLFERGLIGDGRREVTETFFSLLRNADQSCYDHVLRRFLGSINPRTEWLLGLPAVFSDVAELGREYAGERPHFGVAFFDLLGSGGLGETPALVRCALSQARRLRQVDTPLSLSFLRGYARLADRLEPRELDLYVEAGLASFARNRAAGLAFMEGTLQSCEAYLQSLTRECRLQDHQTVLGGLVRALTSSDVTIQDLGSLDTDNLIERGCQCVCLYRWLYLPSRVGRFPDREANWNWYKLATVVASATLAWDSFSRIHGHPDYATAEDLVGPDPAALNAFMLAELWRVLSACRQLWPGIRRLLDAGLQTEFAARTPGCEAEDILRRLLVTGVGGCSESVRTLLDAARGSVNVFETASLLTPATITAIRHEHPGLARGFILPVSFVPDFLFPGRVASPPHEGLIADLKQAAEESKVQEGGDRETSELKSAAAPDGSEFAEGDQSATAVPACYIYPEWSRDEGDYLRDYCYVHEQLVEANPHAELPASVVEEGRRLSRVFERFKPELTRREKYLQDGDDINCDRLVDFIIRRREGHSPRVDFYEKPRLNRRDLAVLILLDASGSTGETAESGEAIIEAERRAALVLGQGLNTLGDRFAICGFNSNGRENCVFQVYKDIDDAWTQETMARVSAASPACSTRIGPALRHAGWRMGQIGARQRLIIIITDGRPMDTGYDPDTRYAQHDVRAACEENEAEGIHTFAISTEENSLADMEIMFPGRRFVILPDMRRLPKALPMLYTRITM